MAEQIEHREREHRFVLNVEGREAELTYRLQGKSIIFDHTGVPPELQHRGLANRLAEAALTYAPDRGLKVDPECRFMAIYLQRHREFQDLL